MSDERLREAERKWRETGAVEDEARYLLERVRVGDLTQERLELAAYCGHQASTFAASRSRVDLEAGPGVDVETWFRGLTTWGREPLVQAAALMARIVLRNGRGSNRSAEERSRTASVEEWIACPCQPHLERALEAGSNALQGTGLEDAGWCAAAAASTEGGPILLSRVARRTKQRTPDAVAEIRAGLIEQALSAPAM